MRPSAQNLASRPFTNPLTLRNSDNMLVQEGDCPSDVPDQKVNSATSQPVSAPDLDLNTKEGTVRTRLKRNSKGVWALDETRGFFEQSAVDDLKQENLQGNQSRCNSLCRASERTSGRPQASFAEADEARSDGVTGLVLQA